jgi:hypothetical protein
MSEDPGDDLVPACGSDDVSVVVHWQHDGPGLRGQVLAENVSGHVCRLANKPDVTPLRVGGKPLRVRTIMTLEWRDPGYVDLQPGQRAAAPLSWGSWCGLPASDQAQVVWAGGSAVAQVTGPTQPECVDGESGDLTTDWFHVIE